MSEPNAKGDSWIVARLEEARRRNRAGDNPNLTKGRMAFAFSRGKIVIEAAAGAAA